MRVGINGMGRIGRLALRASLGGMRSAGRRSARRQPSGRRARQRDQGRGRGDRPPPRIRQPARALAPEIRASRTIAASCIGNRRSASLPRRAGRGAVGRSRLRDRARMHRKISQAGSAAGLFRPRRAPRHCRGAGQGPCSPEHRGRRERRRYEPARAPAADGGVMHDQLPGARS